MRAFNTRQPCGCIIFTDSTGREFWTTDEMCDAHREIWMQRHEAARRTASHVYRMAPTLEAQVNRD